MKKEIAIAWANALESGKYQQTRYKMRNAVGMCCLGVLCDLHAQETGNAWTEGANDQYFGARAVPPQIVNDWCDAPNYDEPCHIGLASLSGLNDAGDNFTAIAAIIRRDWESL